jgi:hypothetical protein
MFKSIEALASHKKINRITWRKKKNMNVTTPFVEECEDDTHTLEMGTWESFETFKTSEFDYRGQNT